MESNYDDLWNRYDRTEDDKWLIDKHHLCHDIFYSLPEGELKNNIKLELDLQNFCIGFLRVYENTEDEKLAMAEPYIKQFKESCNKLIIEYFRHRFEATESKINKSRYGLGCWFLTNEHTFLEQSIQLFIEFSSDHEKETNDRIHYLIVAFNLSKIYNLTKFLNEISNLCISLFYEFIETEPKWVMEPVEIFSELNKMVDHNLINNMISNLHKEANQFFLQNKYHLHQSLLKTSLRLIGFMNLEQSAKEQLRKITQVMIGESKEHDGNQRWKKNEAMGAVWCFEQAKENYEKGGNQEKITEMLDNIRRATQDIQWKEFKLELTMPKLELHGNTGEELIDSIVQCQEKIPNLDFINEEAQRELQQNPLLSMVSHTAFNEKNPVAHATDDDAILQEKMRQLSIWNIRLGENRLSLAVKTLEDEARINAVDMIKFFEQSPLVDSDQLSLLKSGIENHFKRDYVASLHTLTPQIEGMLRRIFEKKEITLLKTKRGAIMDAELGGILNKPESIEVLGRDFANYLRIRYADPTGLNQRNEVSHALAQNSVFSYSNSLSLIHDLMILSRIS